MTFASLQLKSVNCTYERFITNQECIVTDTDKFILNSMVSNSPAENFTLKSQLENQLNSRINYTLGSYICCEDSPTSGRYRYESTVEGGLLSVYVNRNNLSIVLDKTGQKPGIYSSFLSKI